MGILSNLSIAAVALALTAGSVAAATFTYTEGNGQNRKLVAGSVDLDDADPGTPGFGLGDFDAGDVLQIHGRIVSSQDTFSYSFNMASSFRVLFDLDGYTLADGLTSSDGDSTESLSGLVGQSGRGGNPEAGTTRKGVRFTLSGGGETQTRDFLTDILDGADPFIFSGSGMTNYTLTIDGSLGPSRGADALYDIRIEAVPVPASGLFLFTGIAAAAFGTRLRKKKTG